MATKQENIARFQEIANRGLAGRLPPEMRSRFDEAVKRGIVTLPQSDVPQVPDPSVFQGAGAVDQNPSFLQRAVASAQSGADVVDIPVSLAQTAGRGIGTGATRLAGGLGQLVGAATDAMGLTENRARDVTRGARTLENRIKEAIGQPEIRGLEPLEGGFATAAEVAPALPLATTGSIARIAGREAVAGGVLGAGSFIEDEERAGLSAERLIRSGAGLTLGAALPTVLGAAGKAVDFFSPSQARRLAVEDLGPEAIARAREAVSQGIVVTPGGAEMSLRRLADEGRLQGSDAVRRLVEQRYKASTKAADNLVNSFYDDILPEGTPVQVADQVSELYTRAYADTFDLQAWGKIHGNDEFEPMVNEVLKGISRDPALEAQFNALPPDSIGRVDMVKKFIDGAIASKEVGDKSINKAAIPAWKKLKDEVVGLASESSPAYAEARGLAQRRIIVNNLQDRLKGTALETDANIFEASGPEFYRKVLKSKGNFNSLLDELKSIQDRGERANAIRKAKLMRRVIGSFAESAKVQEGLVKAQKVNLQERSRPEAGAFFSALEWFRGARNDAAMRYITDPNWSGAELEAILKQTSARDKATTFGALMSRVGTASQEQLRNE